MLALQRSGQWSVHSLSVWNWNWNPGLRVWGLGMEDGGY